MRRSRGSERCARARSRSGFSAGNFSVGEHAGECFLGQVFGTVRIAGHTEAKLEDRGLPAADQAGERGFIVLHGGAPHELLVGGAQELLDWREVRGPHKLPQLGPGIGSSGWTNGSHALEFLTSQLRAHFKRLYAAETGLVRKKLKKLPMSSFRFPMTNRMPVAPGSRLA
jgi:hypothetical protein